HGGGLSEEWDHAISLRGPAEYKKNPPGAAMGPRRREDRRDVGARRASRGPIRAWRWGPAPGPGPLPAGATSPRRPGPAGEEALQPGSRLRSPAWARPEWPRPAARRASPKPGLRQPGRPGPRPAR